MYSHSGIFGVNQGASRTYTLSPTLRNPNNNLGVGRTVSRVCVVRPASKTSAQRRETRPMAVDGSNEPDEAAPLKRSELIELLQLAVNTLLLPENLERLKTLMQSKKIAAQDAEVESKIRTFDETVAVNTYKQAEILTSEGLSDKDGLEVRQSELSTASTVQSVDDRRDNPSESVADLNQNALTDIRKLKELNVHTYVHNALRRSAMRSWLQDRKIEE